MSLSPEIHERLKVAEQQFWGTRETQAQKQGSSSGSKDAGARSAVAGGAQMNGFVNLVRDLLCNSGLPEAHIYCEKHVELPGWYRPEKKWDLLIVADGKLLAGIEFKSQVDRLATTTTTGLKRRSGAPRTFGPPIGRALSSRRLGLGSAT